MLFILTNLVYWRKSELKVSWGVCDFMNYLTRSFFLRLKSVGEIVTWVFLDWKGRALSKRGVVYETSVSRTESVDGKQREGFYVVSYRDEPCLEMFIFSYVTSQCWSENFWEWRGMGGDQNMYHVLFTRH